jgi:hypothetical protein
MKKLYKGDFNWYGEVHTYYRYAANAEQAGLIMTIPLAKKLGKSIHNVRGHFRGKDNYRIEEIKDEADNYET